MDMQHIKVVFFDPSPPFVDECKCPLLEYSTHCCSHSTMEATWTYKVHLCAYEQKVDYIFYLAE